MTETIDNIRLLTVAYTEALTLAYRSRPEKYKWPETELPQVVGKMINQIIKRQGGYGISTTLRTAMENLGVKKVTYKSIDAFLDWEITEESLTEKGKYYYEAIIKSYEIALLAQAKPRHRRRELKVSITLGTLGDQNDQ